MRRGILRGIEKEDMIFVIILFIVLNVLLHFLNKFLIQKKIKVLNNKGVTRGLSIILTAIIYKIKITYF